MNIYISTVNVQLYTGRACSFYVIPKSVNSVNCIRSLIVLDPCTLIISILLLENKFVQVCNFQTYSVL